VHLSFAHLESCMWLQVTVYCPSTGIEQVFPCRKWLSTSEGDGLIQRTLYEDTGRRKKKDKSKWG